MDVDQLRQDVAEGTVQLDRLVELIASQQKLIQQLQEEIEKLNEDNEKLKEQCKKNPTERLEESYSEKAEEKRQAKAKGTPKKRKIPKRSGRLSTAEKIARAARTEKVYPDDCDLQDCKFSHTRVAWRLEDGRAVLIAYEIYRRGNSYGQPSGVPGRGEFGMEILIALAYQVYTLGLSLDKACQVLGFFQGLSLKKSQANALLNQLARTWEKEFDTLCMLLASSSASSRWTVSRQLPIWHGMTGLVSFQAQPQPIGVRLDRAAPRFLNKLRT